jgi:type VI secretion system secreted protein VgrG
MLLRRTTTLAGLPVLKNWIDQDLGGLTLTPGVYRFDSTAQLAGTLTLDMLGDPNALFVFQIGSALTTAPGASVVFTGGSHDANVFWQMGSSATLDVGTSFQGSIVANDSISLEHSASMFGSAVALNGAVTLINNHINAVPEPSTWLAGLSALGMLGWFGYRKQK